MIHKLNKTFLLFLLIMLMGVGSAWAQTTPSKWDGTVSSSLSTQDGTTTNAGKSTNPYLIQSAADLAYFGSQMNGKDWYVKLTVDVDLDNREWTYGKNSTTNFKGHFDGNGKTISNLSIVPTSAKNNGFFSSLQGTAASRAEVKNLIIDGVTISQSTDLANTTISGALAGNVTEYTDIANVTVKNVSVEFKNLTNANYVGGFIGRVEKNNSKITTCSVEKPSIDITGEIKGGASFIGGAIGQFAGSANLVSTIDGMTVTSPSVTINKVSIKDCYIGAVLGRINTYSTVKSVTTSSPTLTYKNTGAPNVALNIGSFAGGIFGVAAQETAVTGTKVTGDATVTIGSNNNVQAVKAGLIGQSTTNVRLEDWTIENTKVDIKGNLAGTASNIGGFIGYTINADKAPVTLKDIKITGNSSVSITGNVDIASQIGGFVGYALTTAGAPVTFKNTKITGNSTVSVGGAVTTASQLGGFAGLMATADAVNNTLQVDTAGVSGTATVSVGGNVTAASHYGGFAGEVLGRSKENNILQLEHITLETANVSIKGAVSAASYFGGLVGLATTGVTLNDLKITTAANVTMSGDITTATSLVGGAIGDLLGANGYTSSINGLNVTLPSVTINKVSYKDCCIGSVFGRINTYSKVNDVTVSNPAMTYNNTGNPGVAMNLGSFAGYIVGNTTKEVPVTNITINGTAQLTIGTETNKTTTEVKAINAGLIGRANSNVRLEVWTIENSAVQVYGKLTTTGSQLGAFAGNLTGAAGAPTTAKSVKITGSSSLNVSGDITVASYLGGFIGQASTNCRLEGCEVTKPTVVPEGELKTATSYVGGAIAYIKGGAGNTSVIEGLTVTTPKVDIAKISVTQRVGAVFGSIDSYDNINNVTVSSPKLNYSAVGNPNVDLYLGTFAGYLNGVKEQETPVTKVTISGTAELTIGTEANKGTTNISKVKAGLLGYTKTNVRLENWTVANSIVQAYGSLTATADYFGGFAGFMESDNSAPLTLKNVKITGNSTVNVTGNMGVGSYLGGFAGAIGQGSVTYSQVNIDDAGVDGVATVSVGGNVTAAGYVGGFTGYLYGKNAAGNQVKADNVTAGTVNFTIGGQTTAGSYYGGLAGRVNTMCELNGWNIKTAANLTFNNSITALSFVGGAIGSMDGTASYPVSATGFDIKGIDINFNCDIPKGIYVGGLAGQLNAIAQTNKIEKSSVSGKIRTTGSHTYTNGDLPYTFGGIVGYLPQSTTTFSEVNNCVSEVDFDLSGLTPATAGNMYSGFVVGGVIGRINTPSRLPESLYYSGKIYAPSAGVGPIVGVFVTKVNDAKYIYDDYTGENIKTTVISADEWAKADDWYFNGYKIGLSTDVLTQTARTKNYSDTPTTIDGISYLTIGENTLKNFNAIGDATKKSKTILIYDTNNKDQDKGIYPQWATNNATYPAYYMYYMQGVNRGNFVADDQAATIKGKVLSGAFALLTLTDANADLTKADNRGFISHALTAKTSGTGYIYKWYVDGVEQTETSANFTITPAFKGNAVAVEAIKGGKAIKRVECKVYPVFRVGDASAATGTKTNPYLIGSADELQLLSYLSTLPLNTPWEKTYTSDNHYNKAYYELTDDIDMSGVADFTPISFATGFKANNGMNLGYVFDGVFDGKQHKISSLKEEWYGGVINANDSYAGWGLFSIVGSPMPTVKVGDSGASPAVIRNLIIDGATLTHRKTNTTFNYNETTGVGASNNVCIGVLAGLVLNNTKIDNIEIRNSKITDEGSSDYSLATRGLYVGGAVGSIQNAFNEMAVAPTGTKLQHIAAQVDIILEHPTFTATNRSDYISMFNIGGIIGRYCATAALQDQTQASMPAYTFYSGSVNAQKAWISPVLGALRYTSQQSYGSNGATWTNFSKQWEGNNNSAATQINITNAQYYNFRIGGELITELYPTESCDIGTRHIYGHADANEAVETYNAKKYQGVNYSARFIDSEGTTLRYLCEDVTDGVYWTWENGFPHMTDQPYKGAHLIVVADSFTAEMENGTASAYRWEVSTDGETWTDVDGASLQSYKPSPSSTDTRLFVAIITADGVEYRTQAEIILPQNDLFSPYVTTVGNSTDGYDLTLNWNGEEPSGDFTVSYQWYKNDRTTVLEGQTSKTLHLSQSELDASDGIVWCAVTINENGRLLTTIYAVGGDVVVVFVDGTNGKDNSAGSRERGWTPETAVKTIDNANLLLKPVAEGGSMDKNYVVVIGTLNTACFNSKGSNPATLTGKWGGTDYKGLITLGTNNDDNLNEGDDPTKTGAHNYVLADTKFEYLTFKSTGDGTGAGTQVNLHCHGKDVWLGKGLVLSNFGRSPENHTNIYNEEIPNFSVILTATNISHPNEEYWTRTKPQVLTIESGHYARILGGRFTNKFFAANTNTTHTIQATAKHPSWAIINIDIDPDNRMTSVEGKKYACDVNLVCAGLTDGTIYEDLEINVHGGIVNTIVGANQGNAVVNGTKSLTPVGGKSGAFGEWPNSSFFGRTIINVEQDEKLKPIMIRNMYGGGLGRSVSSNTGIIVDMYEYGRTVVNMKSGTVLGNIYGGGVGGVLGANPWDPRIPYASEVENDATNVIQNGVQYGGKPAGSPWAKVTLHNRNADGTYSTEEMDLSQSSTTINIYGGTIGGGINGGPIEGNIYGGGDGEVNGMDNTICLQGVGSVFGTSNINIYGGTILGSVYGGSKGSKTYYNLQNSYGQTITHIAEMNGEVNINITGTDAKYPTIGGDIYGAGLGIVSTATEEYLDIARAGNAGLGDEYKTDINITIDMPETVEFPNDIYGGGALGKVDGNTNIILKQGKFTGSIYGGGFGELQHLDKAMVTGTTNIYTGAVNVSGVDRSLPVSILPIDSKIPTIYGGGNMAQVTGNTYINLYHGNITADVFGGGKGLTQSLSGTFSTYGQVNGNTRVLYNNTTKDNKLTGNIYGGGALGAVVGTGTGEDKGTTVVIKGGEVDGDVFGGGKGEEGSEKAKVTGNTNVIVDSGWTETTTEP